MEIFEFRIIFKVLEAVAQFFLITQAIFFDQWIALPKLECPFQKWKADFSRKKLQKTKRKKKILKNRSGWVSNPGIFQS